MRIKATLGFWAMLCFLAWLDPELCAFFFIAAAVHEAGHLTVLFLLKIPVASMTLSCGGAQIHCGCSSNAKEALSALAGPLVNAVLGVLLLRQLPKAAIVSFFLAAINLLPLYPLDGGRILLCVLRQFLCPELAERTAVIVNVTVCCLLMVGACWLAVVLQAGLWPIFAALMLLWRAGNQEKGLQFLRREAKMIESD